MPKMPKKETFEKAPDAPRRFKSAYIFFSTEKHRAFRAHLPKNADASQVAKMVSKSWKSLPPDERALWEELSRLDSRRYEIEKSLYKGPWKVKKIKRGDAPPEGYDGPPVPPAPKRPASAPFMFCNSRRAAVKAANPTLRRGEISKLLSKMWNEAPEELRESYRDQERVRRAEYLALMEQWKTIAAAIRGAWRESQEMAVLETVGDQQRQELEYLQQRMNQLFNHLRKNLAVPCEVASSCFADVLAHSKQEHEEEEPDLKQPAVGGQHIAVAAFGDRQHA